ncbi:hypothetical protein [Mycobacterium sp.]|jgi:hypothetical protein|uniref:hypothetical protein n=1 Tax=Mycobacterium sp. TaxID=1785 RepID=UPI003F9B8FA3
MIEPTELVRRIIDQHARQKNDEGADAGCSCGATGLSDHTLHLAESIVDGLKLRQEPVGDLGKRLRYVSAVFDDELTKLEGAE